MRNSRTTITVLALVTISTLSLACEQRSGKSSGTKTESAAKGAAESTDQAASQAIKSSAETSKSK